MHRYIISILWMLLGAGILSILLIGYSEAQILVWAIGLPMSIIFMAAGFIIMAGRQHQYPWICHTGAVCSLFAFPFCTPIGLYYFWSYPPSSLKRIFK